MSVPKELETIRLIATQHLTEYFTHFIRDQKAIEPKLYEAIEYALLNGGKRMRPLLVYLIGEMLEIEKHLLAPIALSIECIHAYSLVHDDLPAMDDDDLRRGSPTCHIKFDEATAILAGDALQSLAFEILSKDPNLTSEIKVSLISTLAKAAGPQGMVGGQSLDLSATNKKINLDELNQLHRLKTGALLSASVSLPCILDNRIKKGELSNILKFASHIGLAFQIQDDILDIISSTETLGKPQGSDDESNKSTFVSLLGLDGAKKKLAHQHEQAIQALRTLPYNTNNLATFTDFMVTRTY